MTTQISVGFSRNSDTATAAQEAAEHAREQLNRGHIDAVILFSTIHYDPKVCLPVIHKVLGSAKIIGASTAGIILSDSVETRGIGMIAICSDDIMFETGHVNHLDSRDIRTAGKTLAKNSSMNSGKQQRKLFLFFTDGLLNDTSGLLEGIKEHLGSAFSIIGAGSSDDFHFLKTYQYAQKESLTKSSAGMLLGGRLNVGMSCKHGWKPLGKPRIADKVEGHIIKSIGGKKAIETYREYFGEETEALKTSSLGQINVRYPLGIRVDNKSEYLLRHIARTTDDGSIVCRNTVPEGAEIHIMIGNKDSCLRAAEDAAIAVRAQLQGRPPKLIILFESLLRHKLLGRSVMREIRLIKNILGTAPLIGMYSCGEIFSFISSGDTIQTRLQNGSIIILAIS